MSSAVFPRLGHVTIKDDTVYMEPLDKNHTGSKLLDEYVLADVGKIWMGSYGSAKGRQWVFGQYEHATLPVCVYLLERCGLTHPQRADPILVCRALTKMVCTASKFENILFKTSTQ